MALHKTKKAVLKNGKLVGGTFENITLARNYVMNLIWISKSLTPWDFKFIKVGGY